jgi:hypothetical protein
VLRGWPVKLANDAIFGFPQPGFLFQADNFADFSVNPPNGTLFGEFLPYY